MMPGRQRLAREQTLGKGRGVHDADTYAFQAGDEAEQRGVVHRVVAVGKHAIKLRAVEDAFVNFERKAGDADEPHFALLLKLAQRRKRFVNDLVEAAELDVVALDDVEVIQPRAPKALIHAAGHALSREIELVHVIAPAFGADDEAVAADFLERLAEDFFRESPAVVGRRVDEVDAAVKSEMQGTDALSFVEIAVFVAEGGGAVADHGDLQPRFSKRSVLHSWWRFQSDNCA